MMVSNEKNEEKKKSWEVGKLGGERKLFLALFPSPFLFIYLSFSI
jgi:hypothetical protein